MLESTESEMIRLIAVRLFSQNSSLYDHDTSTLLTDGRTNCLGNTALRYASRGKSLRGDFLTHTVRVRLYIGR